LANALSLSCELCRMCAAAIYWSRIARIHYVANRCATARADFNESRIFKVITLRPADRHIPIAVFRCRNLTAHGNIRGLRYLIGLRKIPTIRLLVDMPIVPLIYG
jgi:hypothetical protein